MTFWDFVAADTFCTFLCVLVIGVSLVRIVYHIRNPNSNRRHDIELELDATDPHKDAPEESEEE